MKMAESSPNALKTLGKGETAHYGQFLLFPQCFQKTCTADMFKKGLVWERIKTPQDKAYLIHRDHDDCEGYQF